MEKLKFYNRKYIVNRKLQIDIILHSLMLAWWVSLVHFIFHPAFLGQYAAFRESNMAVLIWFGLFVIFITAVGWGIVLTNRIAGPIYRLRAHMESVADGSNLEDLREIDFRKADYFSELVVPYNKIIARLRAESGNPKI